MQLERSMLPYWLQEKIDAAQGYIQQAVGDVNHPEARKSAHKVSRRCNGATAAGCKVPHLLGAAPDLSFRLY